VFGLGAATGIYLAVGATDMRKGFEGLYGLVRDQLGLDPLSGHLCLFCKGAQPIESFILGRKRLMGVRQAAGEGTLQLAPGM